MSFCGRMHTSHHVYTYSYVSDGEWIMDRLCWKVMFKGKFFVDNCGRDDLVDMVASNHRLIWKSSFFNIHCQGAKYDHAEMGVAISHSACTSTNLYRGWPAIASEEVWLTFWNKNHQMSSGASGSISAKICTHKNFPLCSKYGRQFPGRYV